MQLPVLIAPEYDPKFQKLTKDWITLRENSLNVIGDLIAYMRVVSARIQSANDTYPLRLGLAAAALAEERLDYRDIIVSLAFLHRAATTAGIDPTQQFIEIADMARPQTGEFIRDFLTRDEADISEMVEEFSNDSDDYLKG